LTHKSWCILAIPTLWRLKQRDSEFKANPDYSARPSKEKKKEKKEERKQTKKERKKKKKW
jgi:hypothetical protein